MSESRHSELHRIATRADLISLVCVYEEQIGKMKAVIEELLESAEYWSEYDVPLGIVDRMKASIDK